MEKGHLAENSAVQKNENSRPLITIIIPVYNMEQYLDRCMRSVLGQTYEPLEIILVDDGSQDKSPEMCEAYAAADARVRVIHQENAGLSGAKNTGLDHASGEYLMFIDADDEVNLHYAEHLFSLLQRQDVLFAACNHVIVRGRSQAKRFESPEEECVLDARGALENVCYQRMPDVSSWGKICHKSLFDGLRFPVGKLYEDTYVFAELMMRAGRIAFTPEVLYNYIQRDDSLSHGKFSPQRMQYITAVKKLTDRAVGEYPDLAEAALCRRVFAVLSVRRFFLDCEAEQIPLRRKLERYVRKNTVKLIRDPKVPSRDKVAALSLCVSPKLYDFLWKMVEMRRSFGWGSRS